MVDHSVNPGDMSPLFVNPCLPPPPDILLSDEQRAVLNDVLDGKSLFFTGSAGW